MTCKLKMKNKKDKYNRSKDLARKLNDFVSKLTSDNKDYFETLNQEQLIELKLALSDINNVLTLKTTCFFANWLSEFFEFEKDEKDKLIEKVNQTKPNTNGYDIEIDNTYKIVAEIKCIIPINNSNKFGAAQRNAILDDAIKLEKGKRVISDTSEFIKIIGLIDLGEKTDSAINELIRPSKNIRTTQKIRLDRHEIVKKLKVIRENTKSQDLNAEYIYIKKIKI